MDSVSNTSNIFKILLLGDSNVGKTCIVQRFCDDSFIDGYISTIGIDFKQKMIKLKETQIKLQLWDTAGQERFRALTTAYYRGAMGIIVVYDVANLESFQHIPYWFKNIDENASPSAIKILIGNKCDTDQSLRMVDKEQGASLAARFDVPFFECSCKHNINIHPMFLELCERIGEHLEKNENHFNYEGQNQKIINDTIIKRLEEENEANQQSNSTLRSCSNCVVNYNTSKNDF